ncbi:MAG: hypothetical protein KDD60_05765 [Bdellovibrionales bacterium]|nr:hypothetical protein [Bdellovibrionales bacterium]
MATQMVRASSNSDPLESNFFSMNVGLFPQGCENVDQTLSDNLEEFASFQYDLRGATTLLSELRMPQAQDGASSGKILSYVSNRVPFVLGAQDDFSNDTKAPGEDSPFPWVIATNGNGHGEALNGACLNLFGQPFSAVSYPKDSGEKKVFFQNGMLNAHISRFEIDPKDPLRIQRHLVELLVSDNGLVTVDHAGEDKHLHALREDILERRVPRIQFSSSLALANLVVERQIEGNEKILDQLEKAVDRYSEIVSSGPLTRKQAHAEIPRLMKTLEFFQRKTGQISEVLTVMKEVSDEFSGDFHSVEDCLHLTDARLRSLLSHSAAVLRKLSHVEELHDRQKKSLVDANIERFTVIIGLSAPPIIGDITSKVFLEHFPESHPWVIAGSLALGAGLVLRAEIPKWIRGIRLRMQGRNGT